MLGRERFGAVDVGEELSDFLAARKPVAKRPLPDLGAGRLGSGDESKESSPSMSVKN